MTDDQTAMKKMFNRYKSEAEDAADELMSRVAGLSMDDWMDFQKNGIEL